MRVDDVDVDITRYRIIGIHTTAIEVVYIGIVYLPTDTTVDLLLGSTGYLTKTSATDVALGTISLHSCVRSVGA